MTLQDDQPRRSMLLALVAAPLLTLVASLVQASPTAHDTASELASVATAPGRYQLAGFLGFASMVLYVPALLALARPLASARPRVAAVGLCLSVTGLMALTSLMGSGPVSLAMARAEGRGSMIRLTDAYESLPLTNTWVALMILGFSLGPVVLGVALWRIGFSWSVPALLVAGLAMQIADAGRWPLALGFGFTTAGLGIVALTSWRSPARPRRRQAARPPARRPAAAR